MCGRYTAIQLPLFADDIEIPGNIPPRYNIAPTQDVAVITNASPDGSRKVEFLRWGLIPSWAKDVKIGSRMINARSETLGEKPSFRNAYKRRRCLVLADGYYEWVGVPTQTTKQPVYIRLKSKKPFAFAGVWEEWDNKGVDELIRSCTIITCPPSSFLEKIHHRMPVILPPETYEEWLAPGEQAPDKLQQLLQPYTDEEMEAYAVSKFVNTPKNDSPECITPL